MQTVTIQLKAQVEYPSSETLGTRSVLRFGGVCTGFSLLNVTNLKVQSLKLCCHVIVHRGSHFRVWGMLSADLSLHLDTPGSSPLLLSQNSSPKRNGNWKGFGKPKRNHLSRLHLFFSAQLSQCYSNFLYF